MIQSHFNSQPQAAPARLTFAFVVVTTSLSFFMGQLDVTIVTVALPRMGRDLGAGLEALQWIVDAYTLALAVAMLSAGALGDRLGIKRGLQLAIALASGPILGGVLLAQLGWRWIFLINVPVCALGLVLVARFPAARSAPDVKGLDGLGQLCAAAALALFTAGSIELGHSTFTHRLVWRRLAATASALLNTARQASGAVGVAILGAWAHGSSESIAHAIRQAALLCIVMLLGALLLASRVDTRVTRSPAKRRMEAS